MLAKVIAGWWYYKWFKIFLLTSFSLVIYNESVVFMVAQSYIYFLTACPMTSVQNSQVRGVCMWKLLPSGVSLPHVQKTTPLNGPSKALWDCPNRNTSHRAQIKTAISGILCIYLAKLLLKTSSLDFSGPF